jgi:hypothetical protein
MYSQSQHHPLAMDPRQSPLQWANRHNGGDHIASDLNWTEVEGQSRCNGLSDRAGSKYSIFFDRPTA